MHTSRVILRITMLALATIATNVMAAQEPNVDGRYKTPNPRNPGPIMAGSNFAVTQDGIRMLKDGNVLSVGGNWQSYVDVPGTRNVVIDVTSPDKPVQYAGLVFRIGCVVEIDADGTLLVDKAGIGAVDASRRSWMSRSISLNGKMVIAFFIDSSASPREPPAGPDRGAARSQQEWQRSWPAFVAALAAIQDSCAIPTKDEIFNVMNADVIQNPEGTVVWLLDRGAPRLGTCQAMENAVFGDLEVTWQAVVASVGKPNAAGEVSLKLTPAPSPEAKFVPTANKIVYVGAVLSPNQPLALPTLGQRIVVRGILPRTRSDSFSGVIHNYGAGDSRERSFVVEMKLATFTLSTSGDSR